MTTKQEIRLSKKKRKAEALLNLLESSKPHKKTKAETVNGHCPKTVTNETGVTDASPQKKSRSDDSVPSVSGESQSRNDTAQEKLALQTRLEQIRQENKEMRSKIKNYQESQERPEFHLKLKELAWQQEWKGQVTNELPPLYMVDLQQLLILALIPDWFSPHPRWCKLVHPKSVSHVVMIVVNKMCSSDLEDYEDCLPYMKETFNVFQFAEIISPEQYNVQVLEELFLVANTSAGNPSIDVSVQNEGERQQAEDHEKEKEHTKEQTNTKTETQPVIKDKTDLMLSPAEMIREGYPMPITTNLDLYAGFKFSFNRYAEVLPNSPIFAIDCEMCVTTKCNLEVTRVSVVNEKLECVYDTFVKPYNRITDYVTRHSGITKEILDPVNTRLEHVHEKLRDIMPSNSIWAGQSLNCDLKSLMLFHPYVIDTSVIFNLSGMRQHKTSLKRLSAEFLNETIQDGTDGHCSIEDARATMKLVLLKMKKGLKFGDAVQTSRLLGFPKWGYASRYSQQEHHSNRELFFRNSKELEKQSLFTLLSKQDKSALLIDNRKVTSVYKEHPGVKCYTTTTDKMSVDTAVSMVNKQKLLCVQLHAVANSRQLLERGAESGPETTDEELKTCFRNTDFSIKRIMNALPEKCLVCIVLMGMSNTQTERSGGVFVKIT